MPEAQAPAPPDKAKHTIAISAATMGHDLVKALLTELRNMPDHWSRMNKELQQKSLERIKDSVAATVLKAQHMLTTGEFQAVPAVLDYVGRKGGIVGRISVRKDELCRHALFDAQGSKVLVVITDPAQWLQRMDELKVHGNQADLFASDDTQYDPAKDQPGYRRDQDNFATGPTWADLMKNLKGQDTTQATDPPKGPQVGDPPTTPVEGKPADTEPSATPAGEDTAVDPERAVLAALLERLAASGVAISLGALQARNVTERETLEKWLDSYEKNPKKCKIERPAWLPPEDGEQK
jgi:hypothetical protein